jgi:hypothetical protein
MRLVANGVRACGLAAVLGLAAGGPAAAQMAAPVRIADASAAGDVEATPRAELKGRAPSADAVWVPGFWDFQGNPQTAPHGGYVWVAGSWLEPPVPGARWDPGHWDFDQGWYSWIPAHWVVPGRHGYPPQLQADESTEVEMSAP